MSVLMDLALSVTRAIDKKRLYDWMIAVSEALGPLPFVTDIGPFDTVARAAPPGGSRMLDAPEAGLAAIANGTEVWVESFGGGIWVWRTDVPSGFICDNQTTCRPTAWAATGNDGAFVRELQGNRRALDQTQWFVNSTAADNEGTGLVGDPLQTDVEIQRRWGVGTWPSLTQPVSVTYAQSPAGLTNYAFTQETGAALTILGTRTVDRAGVVLTAVTAQNRATQTRWTITGAGLGATDVGKLAIITQSATSANVGAYGRVLKDNGAGQVVVSPFGTFSIASGFTTVTPGVGDVIDVVSLTTIKVGDISYRRNSVAAAGATPSNVVVFDSVLLQGDSATILGQIVAENVPTMYARTICKQLNFMGASTNTFAHDVCGGGVDNACTIGPGTSLRVRKSGLMATGGFISAIQTRGTNAFGQLDSDCYFQDSGLQCNPLCRLNTQGVSWFDGASASRVLVVLQGALCAQSGAIADWGTSNASFGIVVRSGGSYNYVTKPTINTGLGVGRETLIGGTDKLLAALPYVEGANLAAVTVFA
jgi:hypothetical protein